jgi:predicted hydrolase (HD superfamily)
LITRGEAIELIRNSSKRKHLLLVGKIMKIIARQIGENETEWEIVGILHDLDYDVTSLDRTQHGVLGALQLEGRLPEHCLHAIRSHDFRTGIKPNSRLDYALIAIDTLANYVLKDGKAKPSSRGAIEEIDRLSNERPWVRTNILSGCEQMELDFQDIIRLVT